jgi:hypothetical protein
MMGLLKDIFSFSKNVILEPERQFRKILNGEIKITTLAAVYLVSISMNAFFMSIKPPGFPAEFAQLNLGEKSCVFYFLVAASWGTLFTAVSAALTLHFLRTFYGGRIFLKILLSASGIAACGALAFHAGTTSVFVSAAAGALLFILHIVRREQRTYWRFFQAALALTLVSAVVLPLEFAAVYLRSENLFILAEIAAAGWMLVLFAKLAEVFAEASVPKAALSLFFGSLAALLCISLLYGAGIISKEIYETLFIL